MPPFSETAKGSVKIPGDQAASSPADYRDLLRLRLGSLTDLATEQMLLAHALALVLVLSWLTPSHTPAEASAEATAVEDPS